MLTFRSVFNLSIRLHFFLFFLSTRSIIPNPLRDYASSVWDSFVLYGAGHWSILQPRRCARLEEDLSSIHREPGRNATALCMDLGISTNCAAQLTTPSVEYWRNFILQISSGIDVPGKMRPPLALALFVAWVIVFLCVLYRIRSSGEIAYFSATFPYVLLVVLIVRGATLPGAYDGIMFYLRPDFTILLQSWVDAASQIFFSLSCGLGGLIVFGSYNKFNNNCENASDKQREIQAKGMTRDLKWENISPKRSEAYWSISVSMATGIEDDSSTEMISSENEDDYEAGPIYEDIFVRQSGKRQSVFGEPNYSATGLLTEGKWQPVVVKGVSNYSPEPNATAKDILRKKNEILARINTTPADKRNKADVDFLLHALFPYIQSTLAKTEATPEILHILLELSACMCSAVARYALHMIDELLSKASYDSGEIFSNFIAKAELHLKNSILGQAEGDIPNLETGEVQGLKIWVYSRVLMIQYANIEQGLILLPNNEDNNEKLQALVQKLTDLQGKNLFVKKEKARYAINCIKEIVERLTTPMQNKKMIKIKKEERKNSCEIFLTWLAEHNRTANQDLHTRNEAVMSFLSKTKNAKKGWFDFHVAVMCLDSQTHKKPRNMEILRALVEKYVEHHSECAKKWSSEGEWQTGLVLGSVLEGIVNHNEDRGARTQACLCLVHYFKSLTKRNSLEKLWVQESLQRCLYGPVEHLRQLILGNLEHEKERIARKDVTGETLREHLPITRSMDYLVQRYKKQLLLSSLDFIGKNALKGYFSTTFRGEKGIVKILTTSKGDILGGKKVSPESNKMHQQLVVEAYTLRRLNSKPHPNILRVFAYDTATQPYHLITEYVPKGSLLSFLQKIRSNRQVHMPSPSALIQMSLGILDALIYLNEQHLVHLAVTAANVLIGHNNHCKLTGFQFAREMTKQESGVYEYRGFRDEMALRHAAPECFTAGRFSEKSVVWATGVLLFEMHTYGVAPYNQYSNAEPEKLRDHVVGGGTIEMEECIQNEVRELIEICLQYESEKRPSLKQIKIDLERIYENLIREDNDRPAADYPSLKIIDLAQTKNVMNSCCAVEDRDQDKNIGFFGSPTNAKDIPIIREYDGVRVIRELVKRTQKADLQKLKALKHKNLVEVRSLTDYSPEFVALETEDSARGNLLQMVLDKQCSLENLVTFIAQIAQALCYMHDNDVIHADVRAEHIMVFSNRVKLSRLGRSKSVEKTLDMKGHMPEDSVRWSAPEVIKDGIYSHSSDVYSFGIMCYELFTALDAREGSTPDDVRPFRSIKDNQILGYLEGNNRPPRPHCMPIWLNIIIKQCLLHKPVERPPFLLIVDALTSCKPFESCLLYHWMTVHENELDNIDIKVTQPAIASHVIHEELHKTFEELYQEVAVEVFMKHTYDYKPGNQDNDERDKKDDGIKDDIYDDAYSYNRANMRSPLTVLTNSQTRLTDNGENHYQKIVCSTSREPQSSRALPPSPPNQKKPVQETDGPELLDRTSKLALYATTPLIDISTSVPPNDKTSDYNVSSKNQGKARNSPSNRPSLPPPSTRPPPPPPPLTSTGPANRGQRPNSTKASDHSPPTNSESINYDANASEVLEGAVGGEPEERSWHSMQYSGDRGQGYESVDYNPGATETSWYPSYQQQQNTENCSSTSRDCTSQLSNVSQSQNRQVPVPRKRNNKKT